MIYKRAKGNKRLHNFEFTLSVQTDYTILILDCILLVFLTFYYYKLFNSYMTRDGLKIFRVIILTVCHNLSASIYEMHMYFINTVHKLWV